MPMWYNVYMKRRITQKIRKKIKRSGKATCEICQKQNILVTHHIEGRDIPNANHPSNLVNICPNCHNLIHEGIIVIEGWFQTTHGMSLLHRTKEEESFTGDSKVPYIIPK